MPEARYHVYWSVCGRVSLIWVEICLSRVCEFSYIEAGLSKIWDSDEQSLHASRADESYFLGPADEQPYQNAALLIEAGRRLGVDAIHPGAPDLSTERWGE